MFEVRPQVIQLGEYDPVFLAEGRLTQELGRRILNTYKRHIAIDWPTPKTDMHWRLCSLGYVGHIPLSEDLTLSLTPKTSIGNLFRMLEWAYNLGSLNLFDGEIQSDSLDDIYQMLAKILATRVLERGRKGLYREYQGRGERLPYLRGRVDMARAMLRPWEADFPCHYEDHTADNEDNRILSWTLCSIARSGVCRGEALSAVRQAFLQLRGATRLEPQLPKSCIGRLYNRLNSDYHPLHALCRFFLEQMGPSHDWGARTMIPFLVNMGRLYELFAARWLAHHLCTSLQLKAQERVTFEENDSISMNIDLVVEESDTGRVLCVMDTKYKAPEQAAEADIYQAVAYAEAKGCDRAFLIYPEPLPKPLNVRIGKIWVKSLTFGLSDDLDIQGQRFLAELSEELTSLCRSELLKMEPPKAPS